MRKNILLSMVCLGFTACFGGGGGGGGGTADVGGDGGGGGGGGGGTPGNHPPTPTSDFVVMTELSTTVIPILANDTDPDGDPLHVETLFSAHHGSAQLLFDGQVSYTPTGNYVGTDDFGYIVSDGKGGKETAFVGVIVNVRPADFLAQAKFGTGNYGQAGIAADINQDGLEDLIVQNVGAAFISVYLAEPAGLPFPLKYSSKVDFAAVSTPDPMIRGNLPLVSADWNQDGKPDFASVNFTDSVISVFLNTTLSGAATPTFDTRVDIYLGPSTGPLSLSAGDFDQDGIPDLAVLKANSGNIQVSLNRTTAGSFSLNFLAGVDIGNIPFPYNLIALDVNQDGKIDLVSSTYFSAGFGGPALEVYLNTTPQGGPTASFQAANEFALFGLDPRSIAVGDFDGDGVNDVAIAALDVAGSVEIFQNTTVAGSFAPQFEYSALTVPTAYCLAAGEWNLDQRVDLLLADPAHSFPYCFNSTQEPAGLRFEAPKNYPAQAGSDFVFAADLDHDGKADWVGLDSGSDAILVLFNKTSTP